MGNQRKIGETQLFAQLQDGPITNVYKGYQESLLRNVLVKVLCPEYESDDVLVKRFLMEAQGNARIQHPNVVAIYEYGESDGQHYFVAEYVDGQDLEDVLTQYSLPPEIAWYILSEVTRGLQAAHRNKVVHRDLKSSNILISNDGEVKLADFGMSDLDVSMVGDTTEEVKGTEHYFAPEVVLGEQVGTWSDIFSLGITFYEMLAGIKPFQGHAPGSLFKSIVEDDPIPYLHSIPSLPDSFINVCAGMLGKHPEGRFKTCEEILLALEKIRHESGFEMNQEKLAAYLESPDKYHGFDFSSNVPRRRKNTYFYVSIMGILTIFLFTWQLRVMSTSDKVDDSGQQKLSEVFEGQHEPASGPLLDRSLTKDEGDLPENSVTIQPALRNVNDAFDLATGIVLDSVTGDEPREVGSEPRGAFGGWLDIGCSPWASVFIEGDSIGTTPLSGKLSLQPGEYLIELKNPEFPVVQQMIHISSDSTTRVNISLLELVASLTLDIHPWAEVYIDGEYMDTLPPQRRPFFLAQGEHVLQLKHPTLGQWQTSIQLNAGQVLERRFNLISLLKQ